MPIQPPRKRQQPPPPKRLRGAADLDRVEVRGVRASLASALVLKQGSMQMVDAIVAEDIGKFPDNNLVEALQRVSGVQTTDRGGGEVSTVSIRGLNDVTTTINGRNIFTASGRSVALGDVPASLLANVEIYKTRSASLIETGIAGQIDIHTQRPFNFDGRQMVVAARGIYQEQVDKTDPTVSALFSNVWNIGSGRFGALLNASYTRTNYRDQRSFAGAMVPFFTDQPPPGFAPYERIATTIDGEEVWQPGLDAGLASAAGSTVPVRGAQYEYLLSRDAVFSHEIVGKRERPAANLSLQWAPNTSSEYLFEAFYNGYRDRSVFTDLFFFVDAAHALGDDPASTITIYPGTNIVQSRRVGDAAIFSSGSLRNGHTDNMLYALSGRWQIGDGLQLKSELVYQNSDFQSDSFTMRTDRTAYEVWANFDTGGGKVGFGFYDNPATPDIDESDATDSAQWVMAQLYDNENYAKGDALTWTLDGAYTADWGPLHTLAFGARYDDRSAREGRRTADAPPCDQALADCSLSAAANQELMIVNRGFFDGRADVPTSWAKPNAHYIYANRDFYRQLYGLPTSEQLVVSENFNVNEETAALYAQTDFAFDLGDQVLDGQLGLRYVNVETDMRFGEGRASASESKLLPSAMLRYNFTPDLMLRMAYGQTLRRPNFSQLNPNIIYVEDTTSIGYGTATGGNPALRSTKSKNYDLSLEWYFSGGNTLYGALFRRDVEGMVSLFRRRVRYEDYDYILTQPDNAANGKLEGFELGAVYFPDNLPDFLHGLGVQASYTRLRSSQDIPVTNTAGDVIRTDTVSMFGISDSSYSVVLAYERSKLSARLSYVWRDDFLHHNEAPLFANPLPVYFKAEASMDFQLSYAVSDALSFTFDATNLNNQLYQSYYLYPSMFGFGSELYSRTFALGLRYRF